MLFAALAFLPFTPVTLQTKGSGDPKGKTLAKFAPKGVGPKVRSTPRLVPLRGVKLPPKTKGAGGFGYDPTSAYDSKGVNVPRGFAAGAPQESVDPFSGNVVIRHTDLSLTGVAGLDLTLTRIYNSKVHRNYAARASGDPNRIATGMLFAHTSMLGLGWTMHMGRLVGANQVGRNDQINAPRYYEKGDGSQHPYFQITGPGCGNEVDDVCLITKARDNVYYNPVTEDYELSTTNGLHIVFGHREFGPDINALIYYATLIEDPYGNKIEIFYHGDTISIGGTDRQFQYLSHFIDYIIDSAGRRIDFHYSEVNPDTIRLTSITAVGRTFSYSYTGDNPWGGGGSLSHAFLCRDAAARGGAVAL